MKTALLALAFAAGCAAQLAVPNASGVAMGHVHFKTRDVAAHRRLWVEVLGAKPGKLGRMEMMKLPGTIVLYESGEPGGGTEGTVVREVGLKVRDLKTTLAKAKSAGIPIAREIPAAHAAFLTAPEGVSIELVEDPSLATATACHHIHFFNQDVNAIQAWYVKMFGARPGKRAGFEAADLPGVNLTFAAAEGPTPATKGRALDHIGFEVRDLEAFCRKLDASGVKFDLPYRKIPSLGIAIAFLTDPWGTYIELTEGLNRL